MKMESGKSTGDTAKIEAILRAVAEIDLCGSAYWKSLCAEKAGSIHIAGDGEIFTHADDITLEGDRFSVFGSFLINRDCALLEFGFGDIEHIRIAGRFHDGRPIVESIESDNPFERWFQPC